VRPDYVSRLRRSIGPHELLWLPGVNAVVFDDSGRVLLQRHSDNHRWSILSGILHPGESPSEGVCREIWEETSLVVTVDRLISVTVSPVLTHRNGDRAQYLELTFRCTAVEGVARVNDDESDAVAWFPLDALPRLDTATREKVARAAGDATDAWFEQPTRRPS
jgi:8-oxo-dGTP pyrophosphatase MutT (NUDIX family)